MTHSTVRPVVVRSSRPLAANRKALLSCATIALAIGIATPQQAKAQAVQGYDGSLNSATGAAINPTEIVEETSGLESKGS